MKNKFLKLKDKDNVALTLEGGGARGGYQVGALKALYENGYKFSAVVGTSIGAINGVYIAQNDFEKLYEMWQTMSYKDLLDLENDPMNNLLNVKLKVDDVKYLSEKLGEAVKNGGLDIAKEREILERTVDEKKLRNSDILYGLVATCVSDVKGEELFIDEIKKGKVVDYIIASSNLPVFKRSIIGDKKYLDGGLWDNCPVHMLEKRGFKDVVVIRAHKRNNIRDYKNIVKRGKITIHMIEPIDSLGSILNFNRDNLDELLLLGYYDALRILNGYDGFRYYFENEEIDYEEKLKNISIPEIISIVDFLSVKLTVGKHVFNELIKKIIPFLVSKTKVKKTKGLKNSILAFIEHLALNEYIDRYKVYKIEDMVKLIKEKCNYNELSLYSKAMYKIVINLWEDKNEG